MPTATPQGGRDSGGYLLACPRLFLRPKRDSPATRFGWAGPPLRFVLIGPGWSSEPLGTRGLTAAKWARLLALLGERVPPGLTADAPITYLAVPVRLDATLLGSQSIRKS